MIAKDLINSLQRDFQRNEDKLKRSFRRFRGQLSQAQIEKLNKYIGNNATTLNEFASNIVAFNKLDHISSSETVKRVFMDLQESARVYLILANRANFELYTNKEKR